MPAPTPVDGTALVLTFAGVDYQCSISSWEISSEDSDVVTFCEAAEGGAFDYVLSISALSATASGSLWRYVYANPGLKSVAYVVKPHGNTPATVDKPWLGGTLTVPGGMPTLGAEASNGPTRGSFDVEFRLDQRPTLTTS